VCRAPPLLRARGDGVSVRYRRGGVDYAIDVPLTYGTDPDKAEVVTMVRCWTALALAFPLDCSQRSSRDSGGWGADSPL
jgi:hypothetical protein